MVSSINSNSFVNIKKNKRKENTTQSAAVNIILFILTHKSMELNANLSQNTK